MLRGILHTVAIDRWIGTIFIFGSPKIGIGTRQVNIIRPAINIAEVDTTSYFNTGLFAVTTVIKRVTKINQGILDIIVEKRCFKAYSFEIRATHTNLIQGTFFWFCPAAIFTKFTICSSRCDTFMNTCKDSSVSNTIPGYAKAG